MSNLFYSFRKDNGHQNFQEKVVITDNRCFIHTIEENLSLVYLVKTL